MNKVELDAINKIVNSSAEELFEVSSVAGAETNIRSNVNNQNIKTEEKSALEAIYFIIDLMKKVAQKQMTETDLETVVKRIKENDFLKKMKDAQDKIVKDIILCGAESNSQAAKKIQRQEILSRAAEEEQNNQNNKKGQSK